MAKKFAIRTEKAPAPLQGAPYSQAVRVDNLVFVSGQIALRPGESALTGATVAEGVAATTERMDRVEASVKTEMGERFAATHSIFRTAFHELRRDIDDVRSRL